MYIEYHLQINLGFSLNSGHRNTLCSQDMNSVLIQVSQTNKLTRAAFEADVKVGKQYLCHA